MLKKHWKPAVLALAALLSLTAVLWALQSHGASTAADATGADAETAAASRMIYERDATQFESLTVAVRGAEPYTVRSDLVYENGELLGVNNALGQPVVLVTNEAFRFKTYAWQMMLLCAQHLPATAEITEGTPEVYGLDDPAFTLTLRYTDGDPLSVSVGDLTPTGDGCYVAALGRTWVVPGDLYDTFAGGLNGTHSLPSSLGFTADQVTAVQIEAVGAETLLIQRKAEGESALIPYEMVSPLTHDVNTERLTTVLNAVCAALPTGYAGSARTDEALNAYGLSSPVLRLTFVIEDEYMAQLTIGGDAADGTAYLTVDRSGDVYTLSKESLSFMAQTTADYLLEQYVALVPVTTLQSVTVTAGENRRSLALGWGEDAAVADGYFVDGLQTTRDYFTALYQQIISPMFDTVSPGLAVSGDALATVVFTLRDGSQTTVRYYPCDAFYDAVEIDGKADYLIRAPKVTRLTAALFPGS